MKMNVNLTTGVVRKNVTILLEATTVSVTFLKPSMWTTERVLVGGSLKSCLGFPYKLSSHIFFAKRSVAAIYTSK